MAFKDELIQLKKELQQKQNYGTRYVCEQIRDERELFLEENKRSWPEKQVWTMHNTRAVIDNQKGENLKETFTELKKGIKSYIAFLLEQGVDFDSIDLELGVHLFIEEEAFKAAKPASELTTDDFLADTINISSIAFKCDDAKTLITLGHQAELSVSYSELQTLLHDLEFTSPERTFEELVEARKENRNQTLRFSIPLTNEKENENESGIGEATDAPKGPSLK